MFRWWSRVPRFWHAAVFFIFGQHFPARRHELTATGSVFLTLCPGSIHVLPSVTKVRITKLCILKTGFGSIVRGV